MGVDGFAGLDPAERSAFNRLFSQVFCWWARLGLPPPSWVATTSLNGPAFGGLVGTAKGFGMLLQDQLRAQSVLFSDETRRQFYAQQQTAPGAPVPMTLGWHIGDRNGRRFFYKEGGGGGFHCMMRLYPGDGVGTVVMTNATGLDVAKLLDAVDPAFFESGRAITRLVS